MKFSLSSSDFLNTVKKSKSLSCEDLSFKYTPWKSPKIGLIVSKKYGNAVKRNLFKRRCRTMFNLKIVNDNINYSVIIRPKNSEISNNSIIKQFAILHDKLST